MRRRLRYSLRVFLGAAVFGTVTAGLWIVWPQWTAQSLLAAIKSKNLASVERSLNGEVDSELEELVREGNYNVDGPYIRLEVRSVADVVACRQRFLISGYGGAHRATAVGGRIVDLHYTFISGGIEYRR